MPDIPVIVTIATFGAGIYWQSKILLAIAIFFTIFLLYFYRYCHVILDIDDNAIVSPCQGTVIDVYELDGYCYIPIFMSPLDRHYQIYPANCRVANVKYDRTGKFHVVYRLDKSNNNEKMIHNFTLHDGTLFRMDQIAGLITRRIESNAKIGEHHKAGDYLGKIKLGSRIDLLLPMRSMSNGQLMIYVNKGDTVNIGDFIAAYYHPPQRESSTKTLNESIRLKKSNYIENVPSALPVSDLSTAIKHVTKSSSTDQLSSNQMSIALECIDNTPWLREKSNKINDELDCSDPRDVY